MKTPQHSRVCATCHVEEGYGDCDTCKHFLQLRRYQAHLRLRSNKDTGQMTCGDAGDSEKPEPYRRIFKRVKRNDLCPCKSGNKFKKCCMEKRDARS